MTWILTKLFVILHSGSIFTCDRYLNKKNLPSQVACNKLNIPSVPSELKHINRCKHVLVCRRLLFQKVIIMRKAYFPKLKDVICNIPVVTTDIVNVVQRGAHSNSRIFAKLKLKLSFRSHAYIGAVSSEAMQLVLLYLKQNNYFHDDIGIDIDNISNELLDLTEEIDQEIPICVELNGEAKTL